MVDCWRDGIFIPRSALPSAHIHGCHDKDEEGAARRVGEQSPLSGSPESGTQRNPEVSGKEVNETERRAYKSDSVGTRSGHPDGTVQHSHQYAVADKNGNVYSSFELKTITMRPASMPKAMILRSDKNSISEATKSMREIIKTDMSIRRLCSTRWYTISYTRLQTSL